MQKSFLLPIDDIQAHPKNPRNITQEDFENLCKSIQEDFDKYDMAYFKSRPCIVSNRTGENIIIAGNKRWEAAKHIGLTKVPVSIISNLTEEQEIELLFKDNGSFGTWDNQAIQAEGWDNLPLSDWGVNIQWDNVPQEPTKETIGDDEVPEEPKTPFVVRGDIFELKANGVKIRVGCLDSTSQEDIGRLMNGEIADMIHTDPPYNVNYEGKTKDALKINNDNFKDTNEFYNFLYNAFICLSLNIKKGGSIYVWHASSEALNFIKAFIDSGFLYKQQIIWVKNSIVLGKQDYHWKHEPCLYGWLNGGTHYFIDDRTKHTLWECNKPNRNNIHPTMKPIELCEIAINNSSKLNENILDTFCGSGSTAVACLKTKRNCFTNDISEKYVQVAVRRLVEFCKSNDILYEITLNNELFDENRLFD